MVDDDERILAKQATETWDVRVKKDEGKWSKKSREGKKILRGIQRRGSRKKERIRGRMKRGEGSGKEKDRLYRLFLRFQNTPDYFSLRCPLLWQRLIVVHFWKIARHECAFKIAGVSGSSSPLPWSFGIPYAEKTSWEDRRESTRHPTPTGIFTFSCSSLSLFKGLSRIF